MEDQALASTVLGGAIVEWLAGEALHDSEPAVLYSELCQRLRGVGMPILRGQVSFRVLHPLYDASSLNWNAERGVVAELFRPEDSGSEQFLAQSDGSCADSSLAAAAATPDRRDGASRLRGP